MFEHQRDISAQAAVASPLRDMPAAAGDEHVPCCDSLLEVLALRLWQLSIWCHRRGFRPGARVLKSLIFLVFGAILEPDVKLEGHVNFAHRGLGVVIHGSTVLGDWVQIWQYVTIASNNGKRAGEHTGVRIEGGGNTGRTR